jgi:oleandomycin transport system permease protein
MKVRTPGAVQGSMFLLVLPLSFVSNAYVPTSTMPSWMQPVADANPMSHLASAVRGLMIGGPVTSDLLWTLGWMAVLLVVFVPLALRAYRRRA